MTSQAEMRSLRFVSWNTDGVKNTKKSSQKILEVLNNLSELHADVVFMQETHIGPHGYQNFEISVQKYWNVFFTVYKANSKGVAILIKKDIKFEYICHDEDYSGGYIVLFCYLYGELFTIVNVYRHKHDKIVLGRLKEYLMETAEGVLVVGGDFNVVLHPSFDRKHFTSKHSLLRELLKDFTASLNLRDTWSYKYPSDMPYTRHQNDSYSRLDMFFMQNDTMERVCDISIITKYDQISDHYPVVLELRVQQKTRSKIPKVALFLDEFGYQGEADRSFGKISGAEILTAIKSMAVSEEQRPDGLPVDYYKRFQHPMSEILKINYNLMFKNKYVPEVFKNWLNPSGRHIFNVDYLIFSDILARRLNALISNSLKGNMKKDKLLIVTFKECPKVKWSFLNAELEELEELEQKSIADILDCLLPKVQCHSGDFRPLDLGCPLTNAILNLALTRLEKLIPKRVTECGASVCHERQALLIHADSSKQAQVIRVINKFQEMSGIQLKIKEE